MPVKGKMGIAFKRYFNNETGESALTIEDLDLKLDFKHRRASLFKKGGRRKELGRYFSRNELLYTIAKPGKTSSFYKTLILKNAIA